MVIVAPCCAKWQEDDMATLRRVDTTPKPFSSEPITDAEAAAMFRAAVRLFQLWGVTDEQAATLLDLKARTYARWKAGQIGPMGRDIRARLSNLMGIHKALRIIFREPPRAYAWMKAPNEAFGGQSALDVMLHGELTDLMRMRRYVDAERGGW
jgi:hypothetical protein